MDIGSGRGYPSSALSNFAPHPFWFDGLQVASMEGLLQAFKFDKVHMQREVVKNVGLVAKKRGAGRSKHWQRAQKLWWNGVEYDRHGPEYQALLDRAYMALATNEGFRKALLATGDAVLTHSIGKRDPRDTVLTQAEFCRRLTALRTALRKEEQ
ncbi:hypothetical protein HOU00_gp409 [Caulobacter phage CcrPW]|uniref:Uncharacterized protein n=1 Tax=Caulobacter phage CcrPW TaxID=2283271 RepID=A0A385EAF2_9CAUD|nr:hypothetical protein HOU00_gp409 [Caulobacter phage CcrPW]AXQ68716.1 hypothetical protein CcrPW_gp177c [Caulobacter phage CcrPW]